MALLWAPASNSEFPDPYSHNKFATTGPSCRCSTSPREAQQEQQTSSHTSSTSSLDSLGSDQAALDSPKSEEQDGCHVALPHSRHLFLCYRQPREWPSSPFSFDWGIMPRALRTAVQSINSVSPGKVVMTVCEGRDDPTSGCYNGDVLLFPDMMLFRALTRWDVQCFMEDALLKPTCQPFKGTLKPEPLTGCHVFICCQRTLDSRCGVSGPQVAATLTAELAKRRIPETCVRVWRCCHLSCGSVQCQGNVVVFGAPSLSDNSGSADHGAKRRGGKSEWYSGVTPADVAQLVDSHILGGQVVERLWVGGTSAQAPGETSKGSRQHRLSLDQPKHSAPMKLNLDSALMQAPGFVGEIIGEYGHNARMTGESALEREMLALHWQLQQQNNSSLTARHRHRSGEEAGVVTASLQPHASMTAQLNPLRSTHSCPGETPGAPYLGPNGSHVSSSTDCGGVSTQGTSQDNSQRSSQRSDQISSSADRVLASGSICPTQKGRTPGRRSSWGSPSALTRANLSGSTVSHPSSPLPEAALHLLRPCPETVAQGGGGEWEVLCEGAADSARPHQGGDMCMSREDGGEAVDSKAGGGSEEQAQPETEVTTGPEDWPFPRRHQRSKGKAAKYQGVNGGVFSSFWGAKGEGDACPSVSFTVGCSVAVAAGLVVFYAVARGRGGSQQS